MEILKSTGIVLSSQVYGESDIVCNFYTREFGKRKFVFKGLKKSARRSRSVTEPGAVSSVVYYYREGRDSCIVNQSDVERYFSAITGNLDRIFHLYFILESVDRTCGFNIADEAIFSLLLGSLEELTRTPHPALLSLYFLLHLLNCHGVMSDAHSCKLCGSDRFPHFYLDTRDLRPVCSICSKTITSQAALRVQLLDVTMLGLMQRILSRGFAAVPIDHYEEKQVLDLLFNISLFVEDYFHTEIKSKSFIFSERFK